MKYLIDLQKFLDNFVDNDLNFVATNFDDEKVNNLFQKSQLVIENLYGENTHHQVETIFKAFGRALRMAITPDPRMSGMIPSTKGSL